MIKKTLGTFLPMVLFACTTPLFGEPAVQDKNTTLLCHFDKGLNANYAKGEGNCYGYTVITQGGKGKSGDAVVFTKSAGTYSVLPGGSLIEYSAKENFPLSGEGTLEFYLFIPSKKWNKGRVRFFDFRNSPKESVSFFSDPKNGEINNLTFWVNNKTKDEKAYSFVTIPGKDVKEKTWHHVAICWDRESLYILLDGKLISKRKRVEFPEINAERIKFGHTFVDYEWLMDELRISDICRYSDRNKN